MRITLLGLIAVLGTLLLVVYVIGVYRETNKTSNDAGAGRAQFPGDLNSPGTILA